MFNRLRRNHGMWEVRFGQSLGINVAVSFYIVVFCRGNLNTRMPVYANGNIRSHISDYFKVHTLHMYEYRS